MSEEERRDRQRDHALRWRNNYNRQEQDIAPLPMSKINWERRLACKYDLKKFCEEYQEAVFYKGWSRDQKKCLEKARLVILEGGMFCLAMPRGGGKTAIVRAALLWAALYGHKLFLFFIGSTDDKAKQAVRSVRLNLFQNPKILQDFPECAYPIKAADNRWQKAKSQLYLGNHTFMELKDDDFRFPCLLLPAEAADIYREHDPLSIIPIPHDPEHWVARSAGCIIRCAGIDGSVRGEADTHPVLLSQPRPDIALLDDIQKDLKVDSPTATDRLIRVTKGTIQLLAGPGERLAVLMPCTVIREGDHADTFLDPIKEPDFQGERCRMVDSWPDGVTDYEITQDTPAGKLWNEYAELRRKSLRVEGSIKLARDLYAANREVMDKGFEVSWPERYSSTGRNFELSGQHHAMELRLRMGPTFLSECQNIGRKLVIEGEIRITQEQLCAKQVDLGPRQLAADAEHVVSFIDVQNEILFWATAYSNQDFDGGFCEYGTWPAVNVPYFNKDQVNSWSLMTKEFLRAYPQYRDKCTRTTGGHVRAPLEAKLYHALTECTNMLLGRRYIRQSNPAVELQNSRMAIDTRWGDASEVIKRFIRESQQDRIRPYYGQNLPPTNRQFEEYERRKGWTFESQVCPNVREDKWVMRPNPDGMMYMAADVSRLKDFLFARLATPLGTPGSFSLFKAPTEDHELFAGHICNSEYPEPVSGRGMTKNQWMERESSNWDNDWLDCAAGCMALLGSLGVSIKTSDTDFRPQKRSLASVYRTKQDRRKNAKA